MSVLPDGRGVRCDGDECQATARLPVALRHTLIDSSLMTESTSIRGWLFAGSQGEARHFCPRCLSLYLRQVLDGVIHPLLETVFRKEEDRPCDCKTG
jgi:hypothetical protein